MKIFLIIALLFLTHTSESSVFNSSLDDQEYVNSCSSTVTKVCMNCKTVGTCTQSGSTYIVASPVDCGQEMCKTPATGDAACLNIPPSAVPECTCASGATCKYDPYDNLSYIKCTATTTDYITCPKGYEVNINNCACVNKCAYCRKYSNSETNCASYVDCGTNTLETCTGTDCFNPTTCNCGPSTCPPCGYKSDPNNSPSGYINCVDGRNMKKEQCPGIQVFISDLCGCATCPACGYITDDNNAPAGYINCKDGSKLQCSSGEIFDCNTCKCVVDPCSKCGYYAYPGDTTKYYKCVKDGPAVVVSCPSGFSFNPDTCYCENQSPVTTTTTTQSSDPCAYCGYFEYPGDKTKYYKCVNGGTYVVANCPTGFTFNPVSCYCE